MGTSTASVSGVYSGQSNDTYTFKALGSGTIGTTSGLQVEVKNSSGIVVATLDVGSTYTAGNTLNVANGVSVSFSGGTITSGNTLDLNVINDSDTTNLLAALGINSFFSGTDASNIAVDTNISNDVSLIAASTGKSETTQTHYVWLHCRITPAPLAILHSLIICIRLHRH